jgi:hypothetical protein
LAIRFHPVFIVTQTELFPESKYNKEIAYLRLPKCLFERGCFSVLFCHNAASGRRLAKTHWIQNRLIWKNSEERD